MHPPRVTTSDPALADRLSLSLRDPDADLLLESTAEGLRLAVLRAPEHDPQLAEGLPLCIDLDKLDTTSSMGRSLKQPILKAVGIKKGNPHRPRVLDATAGLGEDACLLARFGCAVTCLEQHPVIHALLKDAFARASLDLQTLNTNALEFLALNPQSPTPNAHEIVYLDPMFPAERRAKERKPLRMLRWLLADTAATDEPALLKAALTHATRRVVVKRPKHAPPLADREPPVTHKAAAVRYDVYPTG